MGGWNRLDRLLNSGKTTYVHFEWGGCEERVKQIKLGWGSKALFFCCDCVGSEKVDYICSDCGASHGTVTSLRLLRVATVTRSGWASIWSGFGSSGTCDSTPDAPKGTKTNKIKYKKKIPRVRSWMDGYSLSGLGIVIQK